MQIWWRLKTFVNHRIRNASKGVTFALFFDVVVLISIGVELGRGLELLPRRRKHRKQNNTFNTMHQCAIKHNDMIGSRYRN
jgi:hypothetical protein